VRRVADEESFPDECFALPEEALAVLIHLRPEAHLIEGAVELDPELGALNEDEVAVAGAADAFVANGFARDSHGDRDRPEIRDSETSKRGTAGKGRV
jgi:hypothetical protein